MRRRRRNKRKSTPSKRVVYVALIGNLLVTATKFVAAAISGSSAMLSEGLHSLVDTSNELLLMYGMKRAGQQPDHDHPLGHGRELYFWSFIVAILIFALGAGLSLYEGIGHIRHPTELTRPGINYAVLALSFIFELGSWWVAFKAFRAAKGSQGYWEALRQSKDPPNFMVLVEDSAAMLGILFAFAGIFAASKLQIPELDGVASVAIGLLLAAVAALLARESKSLLIGEPADPQVADSILKLARSSPAVEKANGVLTVQMAPDQIVAALSLELKDDLRTPQIEAAIADLERQVRETHPQITTLFVKPQTPGRFAAANAQRLS